MEFVDGPSLENLLERAEPLPEVAGQARERRIARVQRRGEPALGREQLGEPVRPDGERFRRFVRGEQGWPRVGDSVDPA